MSLDREDRCQAPAEAPGALQDSRAEAAPEAASASFNLGCDFSRSSSRDVPGAHVAPKLHGCAIDGTVRRLVLFKITAPTPVSRKLSRTIVEITGEMVQAVSALRKQKGVIAHCIRMKQLENQGDVAYHEAVASLFTGSIDAIEVIKWKDIYENMEGCIDQCEAVAHVLESVVLKHS